MGTTLYNEVKIMDHGTHHNQYFPINVSWPVCTLTDIMTLHLFVKITDKQNYPSVVFL